VTRKQLLGCLSKPSCRKVIMREVRACRNGIWRKSICRLTKSVLTGTIRSVQVVAVEDSRPSMPLRPPLCPPARRSSVSPLPAAGWTDGPSRPGTRAGTAPTTAIRTPCALFLAHPGPSGPSGGPFPRPRCQSPDTATTQPRRSTDDGPSHRPPSALHSTAPYSLHLCRQRRGPRSGQEGARQVPVLARLRRDADGP
jgi:hypothetical protein